MGCGQSQPENKDESLKIHRKTSDKSESKKKTIEAKIVLLGDQHVGKSSIAQRYVNDVFTGQHVTTIGGAYLQKKVILANGIAIKLHLWDTGGQERFKSLALSHYRKALGVFLLFDVTSRKSFEACTNNIKTIRDYSDRDCLIYLIGNKIDLIESRVVQRNEAEIFAKNQGVIYKEISALQNRGVKEVFEQMVYGKYYIYICCLCKCYNRNS